MSEGKGEIIQLPRDQAVTPEVRRIIKKAIVQNRREKDERKKRGIVSLDEERFIRDLTDAVYKPDADA